VPVDSINKALTVKVGFVSVREFHRNRKVFYIYKNSILYQKKLYTQIYVGLWTNGRISLPLLLLLIKPVLEDHLEFTLNENNRVIIVS
jgi:hypothetical protein